MLRCVGRVGGVLILWVRRFFVLILLAGLTSCVKPTVYPRYLTAADVINNVKCELYLAILETPDSRWLDGWTARFTVTLQVFRLGGGSGELSLVVPYDLGTSTISLTGGLEKSSKTDISFNFNADKNLAVFTSRDQCAYYQELRARRNLAGETGLRIWFSEAIRSINTTNLERNATGLTYNLEFVTTVDGGIKPAFGTTYPSMKIFSGDFEFKRQRKDTNTLVIVFAKYVPPVAFADTGLGRALGGIQKALDEAQTREDATIRNLQKADAKLAEEKERLANARQGQALKLQLEAQRSNLRSLSDNESAGMSDKEIENKVRDLAEVLPGADLNPSSVESAVVAAQDAQAVALEEVKQARRQMRDVVSRAQREVAQSRTSRPPVAQSATQQTLSELEIVNAIRNIPRR